jgi:tetratricopeptide (TPR) repeat protein
MASPALIFQESTIVLYVPLASSRGLEAPVRSVVVSKISGPGKGTVLREKLEDQRAAIRGLTPGAYEIEYSTQSIGTFANDSDDRTQTRSPLRRRILVDLQPAGMNAETPNNAPWTERLGIEFPPEHAAKPPAPELPPNIHQIFVDRTNRGWKLLTQDRGDEAQAEFIAAIDVVAGASPKARWRELLSGASKIQHVLRNSSDLSAMSAEMTSAVGGRPELCRTFHGLARAIECSRRSTGSGPTPADALARACYETALKLEPHSGEVWNDLGVLEHRAGLLPQSTAALARAADLQKDAVSLYNLGRCLAESGDVAQALECQKQATTADPSFGPAFYEAARLRLLPGAPACYLSDCRALARHLRATSELFPDDAREHEWAARMSNELAFLAKEEAHNAPDLATKLWASPAERGRTTSPPAMVRLREAAGRK